MYIEQLYTNCLAEAAYYIESEGEAAVIDPLRETSPYLDLSKNRNAKIKYVFETHFHADFVSGHIDLARKADATIVYGPMATTGYEIYSAKDDEEFTIGKIRIRVLHTPGHTPESSCYLVLDENGRQHAIFTGDTLFVGDVGRPDLLDGVMTQEELAGMMYDSLNSKIKSIPDDVIVYPAHGPGSACGKNIGKETSSTIGEQKRTNYALQPMTREEFIERLTDGTLPPPAYFFEDARINKEGYGPVEDVISDNNKPLTMSEVKTAVENGAIILDTRKADDFEKGFIPGSVNIGLNGQFAVWVGTLVDIKQNILLLTEPGKEEESVLRLARIGYENVLGYIQGGIDGWPAKLSTVKSIDATDLKHIQDITILDVRKPAEWNSGHLKDALFLPLSDFPDNLKTLDPSRPYVVHCGGGYRSMTAISIMQNYGFKDLINVYGGYGALEKAGLPLSAASAAI
jgi:glyoxylase-like metal-dependent hydrolase (beta-lactamase superfamily II)/rhodanese-related sulfurtransferase